MVPQITAAHYKQGYTIMLTFADGTQGEVDLSEELYGELFEPLKDPACFKKFSVHPEFRTLCWPNGADFAPEFLYEQARLHTPSRA